jgi:hypothetical protein
MLRRRREQRERVWAATDAVCRHMDAVEAYDWDWLKTEEMIGAEAAAEGRERIDLTREFETLLALVDDDRHALIDGLSFWHTSRSGRFAYDANDDRRRHVSALYLAYGVRGVGNLFGDVPPEAETYDEKLAEAGRERGWRS